MATIAIMVGGAILNAATFIGGNYLAKALSGDSGKAAMDEKIRHDKALEAYQAAYAKYQKDRTELSDWVTIKHTEQRLPFLKNPSSLTSTSLAPSKRMANYCSSGQARLHLVMQPYALFKMNKYTWIPNYQRYTTAHKAIGKAWAL